MVSQFLNSPCEGHWEAVIHVLKYIKGALGKCLLYEDKGHTRVVGYSGADWTSSSSNMRSTSCYCVFLGGNIISKKSKKKV